MFSGLKDTKNERITTSAAISSETEHITHGKRAVPKLFE